MRNVQIETFRRSLLAGAALALTLFGGSAATAGTYVLTNLVTNSQTALAGLGYAPAAHVDPNLVNPWGLAAAPSSPWWVANQGTATETLYNSSGALQPLVVATPQNPQPPGSPGGPTGLVFNGTTGFGLPDGSPGLFFADNLDGSISGWNAGTTAVTVVPGRSGGNLAAYTGLAIDQSGGQEYLYAANNLTGAIDVFNSSFSKVTLAGNFTDPGPNPDGLVPFNVQNIGGNIWVTYAVGGPTADEQSQGSGFVSEFASDGTFIRRFATGGPLLSPWGITVAPSDFGQFSNDVLIGNFSDGADANINAFNPTTGAFVGTLSDDGTAISLGDLWSLQFGNGGASGPTNTLFITAGVGDEADGLFSSISAVPEPASWLLLFAGCGLIGAQLRGHRARRRPLTA